VAWQPKRSPAGFADILASDNYPLLDAPFEEVSRCLLGNRGEVHALCSSIRSAVALLSFVALLSACILGDEPRREAGSMAAVAGATTAAAFLLLRQRSSSRGTSCHSSVAGWLGHRACGSGALRSPARV
jgi:hypothetical protein